MPLLVNQTMTALILIQKDPIDMGFDELSLMAQKKAGHIIHFLDSTTRNGLLTPTTEQG
jgi:hypothetical protein